MRRLPPRIEAGVYRIAQEALANALGHARACTVTMHLAIDLELAGPQRITLWPATGAWPTLLDFMMETAA